MNKILTIQNLLTYIGFNIAIFAFLSQYLSFPKDLLSELSRTKREGELPISSNRITKSQNSDISSDTIKIFFIEHDTITFVTLLYILFSIFICLILIFAEIYPTINEWIKRLTLIFPIFIYSAFITLKLGFEMADGKRNWPISFQSEKKPFLRNLVIVTLILDLTLIIPTLFGEFSLFFLFLILGSIIHFVMNVILLDKRKPITTLLELWENLPKQNSKNRPNRDEKNSGKEKGENTP